MKRNSGGLPQGQVRFDPPGFFEELTRNGQGEVNVAGFNGVCIIFRIGPDGMMAGSLPQQAVVMAKVMGLLTRQPSSGVTVVTEAEERVGVEPVKEIRGYRVLRERRGVEAILRWWPLPKKVLVEGYREAISAREMAALLRNHRFVGG